MSYSSLYCVSRDLKGHPTAKFRNSWRFSPVIWGVLADKYLRRKLNLFEKDFMDRLNAVVNDCGSFADRICWELTMQQIFFSDNKGMVVDSIRSFVETNSLYDQMFDSETGVEKGILAFDHIKDRFIEVADAIFQTDGKEFPFFIFKNTSVDDVVESYFRRYDDESEQYVCGSLRTGDVQDYEFVYVCDGEKISFMSPKMCWEIMEGEFHGIRLERV